MKMLLLALLLTVPAVAQTPDPHSVPVVDGGIGPCTADFTITDTENKPVYAAKVKVRIAYGFASARKLDLEVADNVLRERLAAWRPPQPRYERGVMAKYARIVSSASTGAVTG